jgi:hypothetical protein
MPLSGIRLNGNTWMVSIIHSVETEDGSAWYSERAGKNPIEAAVSYLMDDPEDNPGTRLARQDPQQTLVVVIGQQVAPSMKPWKVYLFEITDWEGQKPIISPFR